MTSIKFARAVAAATLLLVGLAACNDDALPPSAKYATVKGVVTDASTHQPIANATVTVDVVMSTTTASDGSFSISNVPSGSVDYTVTAAGYKPFQNTTNVDPAGTASLDVALSQ